LHPNHDPGRNGIVKAIEESACEQCAHLPRDGFFGLLRRAKVIVGNSSAGLIEGSAAPIRCINIGPRQAGREMPASVVDIPEWDAAAIESAIRHALGSPPLTRREVQHPYGDGCTGQRVAELLARVDLRSFSVRKRNTY
jgi:UDP-N-acetylglucosamine 2-epimerase